MNRKDFEQSALKAYQLKIKIEKAQAALKEEIEKLKTHYDTHPQHKEIEVSLKDVDGDKKLMVSPWLSKFNSDRLNLQDGMVVERLPIIFRISA